MVGMRVKQPKSAKNFTGNSNNTSIFCKIPNPILYKNVRINSNVCFSTTRKLLDLYLPSQFILSVTAYNKNLEMGNQLDFCGRCKQQFRPSTSTVRLAESAVVQFKEDLPILKGRFNFEKQASFNKLQKAALQYCQFNQISNKYSPIIARLLAYQQSHYFQAMKLLPMHQREQFIAQQSNIDLELVDSLYHYFLIKQTFKVNPYQMFGCKSFKLAPTIDVNQIEKRNLVSISQIGQQLLIERRVGLFLMLAGHSQYSKQTSKSLAQLPLVGSPTTLQLLMNKFSNLLIAPGQSRLSKTIKRVPVIILCCQNNYTSVQQIFYRNNFFGIEEKSIKIILDQSQIPIMNHAGKLCLSGQFQTLKYPMGTARAVNIVLNSKIRAFLADHNIKYLHFIGSDNISETPGDPLMLGLTHKFKRDIAGKCVQATSLYQKYPRYVSSEKSYHLVDSNEIQHLGNLTLMIDSPLALNSMVFRLSSLEQVQQNFEVNMYIAKRFHMQSIKANYYDFEKKKLLENAAAFNFQQDIRDYISSSTQTILVKYQKPHFKPIITTENLKQYCKGYYTPSLYS